MDKCGYLNKDDTCNCTALCEKLECIAIADNFLTVEDRSISAIQREIEILEKIKEKRKQI